MSLWGLHGFKPSSFESMRNRDCSRTVFNPSQESFSSHLMTFLSLIFQSFPSCLWPFLSDRYCFPNRFSRHSHRSWKHNRLRTIPFPLNETCSGKLAFSFCRYTIRIWKSADLLSSEKPPSDGGISYIHIRKKALSSPQYEYNLNNGQIT